MMNRNIDILNIKKIYAHQLFNKDILLMKKESKDRHHFSFGEYYDEILLSGYPIEIQSYMLPIHQIIVFSLITKSPVNYTMNIQEAKAIRLADYLQSLVYSPVKQQGNSLWYKSPFTVIQGQYRIESMVRFRAGQRWQYPRTGKGTLSGRLCTLAACQNSRAGTAYSPHIVFFSSATVRTEFSAVGSQGACAPCTAPILAGTKY